MSIRTLVLVKVQDEGVGRWNVIGGDRICFSLVPEEALGLCAKLLLNTDFPRYPMQTIDEIVDGRVDEHLRGAEVKRAQEAADAIDFYLGEWDRLYPSSKTTRKRTPAAPDADTRSSKMAKSKDKPKRDKGRAKGGGKK